MTRGLAAATVAICGAVLAACGAGTSDEQDADRPPRPVSSAPVTGPIEEPLLETGWLVQSTSPKFAGKITSRRSFGYLTDDLAVYSGVDSLLAVDRASGETAWTADLDLDTEAACDLPTPAQSDPEWVPVIFGKNYCHRLAQVRLSDGEVIDVETLPPASNTFSSCFQLESTWYCAAGTDGIVELVEGEASQVVANMADLDAQDPDAYQDSVLRASLTPDREQLVLDVLHQHDSGPSPTRSIVLVDLPSFEPVWRNDAEGAITYDLLPGGAHVVLSDSLAKTRLQKVSPEGETPEVYELRLEDLYLYNDGAVLDPDWFRVVGDDVVYGDGRSVKRVSATDGDTVWETQLSFMRLRGRQPADFAVRTGPMTEDGTEIYATVQAEASGSMDLIRLRLADGEVTGRWAFPDEYAGTMNGQPHLELGDGGILVVRNLSAADETSIENKKIPGDVYDVGWFRFPSETS